MVMKFSQQVLLLLIGFTTTQYVVESDIVVENDEVVPSELYDFVYGYESNVQYDIENTTKYYCIFRNLWTRERHPNDYPQLARWSAPFMFSHEEYYYPYLKGIQAPYGVEVLAEHGTNDVFKDEVAQAGENVLSHGTYDDTLYVVDNQDAYEYLPPMEVKVNEDDDIFYHFISGISSMMPTPDWYTGFYLFDTHDIQTKRLWQHFKLHTYPWDAGTDNGQEYTAIDVPADPKGQIKRFTVETAPNGAFVDPTGGTILPVGEWECVLHVCPLDQPNCVRPDWPPSNGCDILKYPACNSECDPEYDYPCERCRPISGVDPDEAIYVYYTDCCLSGRDPIDRTCGQSSLPTISPSSLPTISPPTDDDSSVSVRRSGFGIIMVGFAFIADMS